MDNHFIQPVYIQRNSPELRTKLEELGYNPHPSWAKIYSSESAPMDVSSTGYQMDKGSLYTGRGFYAGVPIGYEEELKASIDCGTNEDLFLALAALRDDTNNGQWFTDGFGFFFRWKPADNFTNKSGYHKATVEELIKHFKEEEMDKFYIARDSDNSLHLYSKRPNKIGGSWSMETGSYRWMLNPCLYPYITSDDKEPKSISMEEIAALVSTVSKANMNKTGDKKDVKPETGSVKNDFKDDKLRWDLLPMEEIEDIVRVYHAGAKKYGPNRWQDLDNGFERYRAAAARHLMEYLKGERIDADTGCFHLAQYAWNAITMLWYDKHNKGLIQNKKKDETD